MREIVKMVVRELDVEATAGRPAAYNSWRGSVPYGAEPFNLRVERKSGGRSDLGDDELDQAASR